MSINGTLQKVPSNVTANYKMWFIIPLEFEWLFLPRDEAASTEETTISMELTEKTPSTTQQTQSSSGNVVQVTTSTKLEEAISSTMQQTSGNNGQTEMKTETKATETTTANTKSTESDVASDIEYN